MVGLWFSYYRKQWQGGEDRVWGKAANRQAKANSTSFPSSHFGTKLFIVGLLEKGVGTNGIDNQSVRRIGALGTWIGYCIALSVFICTKKPKRPVSFHGTGFFVSMHVSMRWFLIIAMLGLVSCQRANSVQQLAKNEFTLYLACGYCGCWPPMLGDIVRADAQLGAKLTVISGEQCDTQPPAVPQWQKMDTARMGQRILPYNQALLVWKEDGEVKWLQLNASQSGDLHSLLRRLM